MAHCPEGYTFQEGDAVGTKYAIKGPAGEWYIPFNSKEECAELCNGNDQCKAIEWSPSRSQCVLINTPTADGPKHLDYDFCGKGLDNSVYYCIIVCSFPQLH